MVDGGLCSVGSHMVTHPGLTKLSCERCMEELVQSAEIIQDKVGTRPLHFSYPHSYYSTDVAEMVKQAGYHSATRGYGGVIRTGDDVYRLNRVYVTQAE